MEQFSTDYFKPSGTLRLEHARLLRQFVGREGLGWFVDVIRNNLGSISSVELEKLDRHFFQSLVQIFSFIQLNKEVPLECNPLIEHSARQFYWSVLMTANGVVQEILNTLLPEETFGPLNSVSLLGNSPSDRLRQLAQAADRPRLRFELMRQLLLAYIASHIRMRNFNEQLMARFALFEDTLSEYFFSNNPQFEVVKMYALHRNDTNEMVQFCTSNTTPRNDEHIKLHGFKTRLIHQRIGMLAGTPVLYHARPKNDSSAVIKTLREGIEQQNGIINPLTALRDSVGMTIVVLDEEDSRAQEKIETLVEMVQKVLQRELAVLGPLTFTRKDQRRGFTGQSPRFHFTRLQCSIKDKTPPIELIFQTAHEYINGRFDVGYRDPDTSLYNGAAHRLYEIERIIGVAPLLFPLEVYRNEYEIMNELTGGSNKGTIAQAKDYMRPLIMHKVEETAAYLRQKNRIAL